MLKYVLVLLVVLVVNFVRAQERADSLQISAVEADMLYRDLFIFSEQSSFGPLLPHLLELKPQFGWKSPLMVQPADYYGTVGSASFTSIHPFHPFLSNFSVNSAATYRLSDRLLLSGSSISANSIFNPVQSNHPSQMNFQGVNLYLEYKVSDKFRIGGGVSVNRNPTGY